MPNFNSVSDLAKFLGSPSGQSMLMNDNEIKRQLQIEMDRLQRYLTEEIINHYNSFSPIQYQRTGAWIESIRVNPIQKDGLGWSISLTFDDAMANHSSVVPGGQDGYVPWLMEVGWKNTSYPTPHFLGFKGTHYIQNAVERWNKDNKFGFRVSVFHGNEQYI